MNSLDSSRPVAWRCNLTKGGRWAYLNHDPLLDDDCPWDEITPLYTRPPIAQPAAQPAAQDSAEPVIYHENTTADGRPCYRQPAAQPGMMMVQREQQIARIVNWTMRYDVALSVEARDALLTLFAAAPNAAQFPRGGRAALDASDLEAITSNAAAQVVVPVGKSAEQSMLDQPCISAASSVEQAESDAQELWTTLDRCGLMCKLVIEKHRANYGSKT